MVTLGGESSLAGAGGDGDGEGKTPSTGLRKRDPHSVCWALLFSPTVLPCPCQIYCFFPEIQMSGAGPALPRPLTVGGGHGEVGHTSAGLRPLARTLYYQLTGLPTVTTPNTHRSCLAPAPGLGCTAVPGSS